jgi:hypothetical protein
MISQLRAEWERDNKSDGYQTKEFRTQKYIEWLESQIKPKTDVQYYGFFNAKDAQHLIGEEVEFFDYINNMCVKGILDKVRINYELPFSKSNVYWRFIRTIPPRNRKKELLAKFEAKVAKLKKELGIQ